MTSQHPSSNEYFPPGTILSCTSLLDEEFKGEVIVFDHQSKFICLKCEASNKNENLNDIALLHMTHVKDVKVLKEGSEAQSTSTLRPLKHDKLKERMRQEIKAKLNLAKARSNGVSPEGQKLFMTINKTFNEIDWLENDIVVIDEIVISPPYRPENCSLKNKNSKSDALDHIRKLVKKFYADLDKPSN